MAGSSYQYEAVVRVKGVERDRRAQRARGRVALSVPIAVLVGLVLSSCGGSGHTTAASVTPSTVAVTGASSATGTKASATANSRSGSGAAGSGKAAKRSVGGGSNAAGAGSGGQAPAKDAGGSHGSGGGAPASGGGATGTHERVSSPKGARGKKHSTNSGTAPAAGTGAPAVGSGSSEAAAPKVTYEMRSLNMEPTYKPYEKLDYDQSDTSPTVDQVVLFRLPIAATEGRCGDNPPPGHACQEAAPELSSTLDVGRVVAVGGEAVAFQEGNTIRNGQTQDESSFTKPCGSGPVCSFSDPIAVPQGSYYILFDNRSQVDDSRVWGAVPQAAIVGVVNGVAETS